MYNIFDKASAIKEIQSYLREMEGNKDLIPSGIYDVKTREAVSLFQEEVGLSVTGVVDYDTHGKLYQAHLDNININKANEKASPSLTLPIEPNEYSRGMPQLNRMITELLSFYRIHYEYITGYYYSDNAIDGARSLRRLYGLDMKDEIDWELYNRMVEDIDGIL